MTATKTADLRAKLSTPEQKETFASAPFLGRDGKAVAWISCKGFGKLRGMTPLQALDLLDNTEVLIQAVEQAIADATDPEVLASLKAAAKAKAAAEGGDSPAAAPAAMSTADRLAKLRGAAK